MQFYLPGHSFICFIQEHGIPGSSTVLVELQLHLSVLVIKRNTIILKYGEKKKLCNYFHISAFQVWYINTSVLHSSVRLWTFLLPVSIDVWFLRKFTFLSSILLLLICALTVTHISVCRVVCLDTIDSRFLSDFNPNCRTLIKCDTDPHAFVSSQNQGHTALILTTKKKASSHRICSTQNSL